jgi:hypothetical protein
MWEIMDYQDVTDIAEYVRASDISIQDIKIYVVEETKDWSLWPKL